MLDIAICRLVLLFYGRGQCRGLGACAEAEAEAEADARAGAGSLM